MKKSMLVFLGISLILSTQSVSSKEVGVLVEFPEGMQYRDCVNVNDGSSLKSILENTLLDTYWSIPKSLTGQRLCKINDVGCPPTLCLCDGAEWNIFFYRGNDTNWTPMPVASDISGECWLGGEGIFQKRYCSREGDVLGLFFGKKNQTPVFKEYEELCSTRSRYSEKTKFKIMFLPDPPIIGQLAKIVVRDRKYLRPVSQVKISIHENGSLLGYPVYEALTDENGKIHYSLNSTGLYTFRFIKIGYTPEKMVIELLKSYSSEGDIFQGQPSPKSDFPLNKLSYDPEVAEKRPETRESSGLDLGMITAYSLKEKYQRLGGSTSEDLLEQEKNFFGLLIKIGVLSLVLLGLFTQTQLKKKETEFNLKSLTAGA
ncbi:MAG: hypothetical protein ABH950_05740 [Candidatus Altiarchaeota archaeon]